MASNQNPGRNGSVAQMQQQRGPGAPQPSSAGWQNLVAQRSQLNNPKNRRRTLAIVSIILLVIVIFAGIRLSAVADTNNDALTIHIANQQPATLDLRQSFPISPYILGANVFPKAGSDSMDAISSGFMDYTPQVVNGLKGMNAKLLRYPGGNWGEEHILSKKQLDDFAQLLIDTGAEGMIQAHLAGPVPNKDTLEDDVVPEANTDMSNFAGTLVDYMNNKASPQRGDSAPYHPVKFWTVGNEPDLHNPLNKRQFSAKEYAELFITYSKQMHQNDPSIQVFGPEISQFYGVGAGPTDKDGALWMETFLKTIGEYERANTDLGFKILDGVSFHRYQLNPEEQKPGMLMSSANEWNYIIPGLRELAKHELGREVPISVSEINVTPDYKNLDTRSSAYAALWWADTLGTLMNQRVSHVGFFSASHLENPFPLFSDHGKQETSMARVMQLYGQMTRLQKNMVPLATQRDPVSVYATVDDKHETISLMFINKSSQDQVAQINPSVQTLGFGTWPSLNVKIAKYGIAVVTVHRGGGAEANSFIPPTKTDGTVAPIKSVVCGATKDPVDSSIPC